MRAGRRRVYLRCRASVLDMPADRDDLRPLDVDALPVVLLGTAGWAIALLAVLALDAPVAWRWTCGCGIGLGLLGLVLVRRRRRSPFPPDRAGKSGL